LFKKNIRGTISGCGKKLNEEINDHSRTKQDLIDAKSLLDQQEKLTSDQEVKLKKKYVQNNNRSIIKKKKYVFRKRRSNYNKIK
jgi:hypothetical protein